MFKNYSEELAENLAEITGKKKDDILAKLRKIAESMYSTGATLETSDEEAPAEEVKNE